VFKKTKPAPIFIIADDDREACQRLIDGLHDEWCYIPVMKPRLVAQYASQFATTAIFLAAPIDYPRGGAAALLQRLIDEVKRPVVVLLESWDPVESNRWKSMGATDCIPHPTRTAQRLETVRSKMQALVLEAAVGGAGC
jgi:hypothetical protein